MYQYVSRIAHRCVRRQVWYTFDTKYKTARLDRFLHSSIFEHTRCILANFGTICKYVCSEYVDYIQYQPTPPSVKMIRSPYLMYVIRLIIQ